MAPSTSKSRSYALRCLIVSPTDHQQLLIKNESLVPGTVRGLAAELGPKLRFLRPLPNAATGNCQHGKESKFGRSETAGIALIVPAICKKHKEDCRSHEHWLANRQYCVLDEPFLLLTGVRKRWLYDLLRSVSPLVPGPTIYVTHHDDDAVSLAESVITLEHGKLAPGDRPWAQGEDPPL
jgi:hypothetical protein